MTVDWRVALAEARRPLTPEQSAWDGEWRRWWQTARRTGRGHKQAIAIAYTRTEDQYGKRPEETT